MGFTTWQGSQVHNPLFLRETCQVVSVDGYQRCHSQELPIALTENKIGAEMMGRIGLWRA